MLETEEHFFFLFFRATLTERVLIFEFSRGSKNEERIHFSFVFIWSIRNIMLLGYLIFWNGGRRVDFMRIIG